MATKTERVELSESQNRFLERFKTSALEAATPRGCAFVVRLVEAAGKVTGAEVLADRFPLENIRLTNDEAMKALDGLRPWVIVLHAKGEIVIPI